MSDEEPTPIEVDEYLTWLALERGRARSTVEAYRRDLQAWTAHLRAAGTAVTEVTEDDLVAWVHDLRSSDLAPSTVKRRIVAISSVSKAGL